ncbi:MAG: hypothetical protein Kow0080_17690 [Candidatus Promineifilaceae bacterium]
MDVIDNDDWFCHVFNAFWECVGYMVYYGGNGRLLHHLVPILTTGGAESAK